MITFYVFPQSLDLRLRAQGGDGPPSSRTFPSPTPLSQGVSVNDAQRLTINARLEACPRPEYEGGNAFRLRAQGAAVTVPHGDITKVELVTRIYRSEIGSDQWCRDGRTFPSLTPTNTLAAFICPFMDIDNQDTDNNGGLPASKYDWDHDTHSFIDGQVTRAGHRIRVGAGQSDNFHNFQVSPSSVNPATPKEIVWDVTSYHSPWDDAKLLAARWGLASWDNDSGFVAGKAFSSGLAQGGKPSSNTPNWNISQMVLRVEADDPPGGDFAIFMDE